MTTDDLPEMCAARHPVTDTPVFIKRGESGCWPLPDDFDDVESWNARHGIKPHQVLAMLNGSMFGGNVPGADPAVVRKDLTKLDLRRPDWP
jgi:hypothetical protein